MQDRGPGEHRSSLTARAKALWTSRVSTYSLVGVGVLVLNLALAKVVFSFEASRESLLARNLANVVVTELALLAAFFAHRHITWAGHRSRSLLHQLVVFHTVSAVGLGARFLIFGALSAAGVGWFLATLASIGIATLFNFVGYDNMAFRRGSQEDRSAVAVPEKP
jgi:putative flippase GtrA